MGLLTALFGTKQDKDLKQLRPIVEKINGEEQWAKGLADEQFPRITAEWKQQVAEGKKLDELLPKAFALAREASLRTLGQRQYDVQLMGAIVLHQGKIMEMKTGEGKTLSCVPAAYLNALDSKGVHVVTVNDYLAKRDAEWMGPIYRFLGLSVGTILSDMDNENRRANYACDITYGTNNEFGFDYLRDNMKWSAKEKIQPKHHFCIIDEIDSILIDESRTPLIISGPADDDSTQVKAAAAIAPSLTECEKNPETGDYWEPDPLAKFDKNAEPFDYKGDYMLDEKRKSVNFTNQGLIKMEKLLQNSGAITGSLYDSGNFEFVHYVTQAVRALTLYSVDVDYVVKDGKIQIVDEFTGRILNGRRYSEGLHQAIEAKEHIKVMAKNKTLATITFQNFFRMYDKLSGMTGTADTEAPEFMEIYKLDVVVIPTNRPVARKDLHDLVYYNEQFKFQAICEEIKRVHEKGQPILVGTVSIEKSELLSKLLRKMGIRHEVLNAKNHEREALIIENAGAEGAVTIATNMAGRGTDIKLGGSPETLARALAGTEASAEEMKEALDKVMPKWKKQYQRVKDLGGLYVLGTERHESRRIDNQLRGRSGRQGDPGTTRFYVSMEDTLMRLFANDNVRNLLGRLGMQTGEPIEHKMLTGAIEKAQKRVEERNFEIRKHLLEYDDVLNEQRNFLYTQRDEILMEEDLISRVLKHTHELCDQIVDNASDSQAVLDEMKKEFFVTDLTAPAQFTKNEWKSILSDYVDENVTQKRNLTGDQALNDFLRAYYLRQIDTKWQNHLDALEELRDAVGLRTYAQKNPLVEYKVEGFEIFTRMLDNISLFMAQLLVRVQIKENPAAPPRKARRVQESHISGGALARARQSSHGEASQVTVRRTGRKIGRNEPCPCGSGKKYKNCCGRNQ